MSGHRPPRWLERILEWALPSGLTAQGILGDLAEGFEKRAGVALNRARLWYAAQTLSIVTYRAFSGSGAASPVGGSDLLADLRWSFRSILRHPGFSLGVVTILGLGLGTIAGVFSLLDGTLRNTTWWADPDRTVAIWPGEKFSFGQLDMYSYEQTAYRSVGGYAELAFAVRTPDGESQSVNGVAITPALFRELAVQPVLGRALADDDAIPGVESVVVLSEALWRRSWGGDPATLGSTIDVSGRSVRVVGIQGTGGAAPGGRAELWLPALMDPRDDDFWKNRSLTLVGVLRPDADLGDAFDDLAAFNDRLSRLFPMFFPPGFAEGRATVAWADEAQRRMISTPLLLLFGGTALLLLVTALNVGNLLLGRAVNRRKELAVRTALGAGRRRIVGQLLVEGTTLTALALGAGLIGASLGGRWIAALFVGEAVVARSSVLAPSVLAFSLAVSALAWLVLNGVPVVHFLRTQRGGPTMVPGTGAGVQRTLVAVQSALATLLLVSATLLVATVDNLRRVPLGFDARNLVAVELSPPEDRVGSVAQARTLYDRLVERATALPGVRSAGLTGWLPLRSQAPTTPINLETAPVEPAYALQAPMHMVDPGFFEALGIEASDGRALGSEDRKPEPSAVVVNRTLADMLWPNGSAVGQRIAIDPHAWDRWVPVVGVVPDVRTGGITGSTGPALYVSLAESPARELTLVVRTAGNSARLISPLRGIVAEVDPMVPVRAVTRMDDVVRAAYSTSWVMMGLLLVLAGLATALGATGIYGVLAHHVAVNRRTIGVRMALGAHPWVVVGSVVRSGLILAWIGILLGSLTALWSTTLLDSLLFEVTTLAPWAYMAPAAALSLAAALAAWIPAARAGRLPPAEVLRSE